MSDEASAEQAPRKRPGSTRALVSLLAFILGFATVPHRVCERDAAKWFAGDPTKDDALAESVARWTSNDLTASTFGTGSSRFDGEWLLATYVMAAMGFGQLALDRPNVRELSLERMERCLDALLDRRMRAFDSQPWRSDALDALEGGEERGHMGYLGYTGLALSLHRYLKPDSRFAADEERFARALARRMEASPTGFVETYPNEVYPADNAAAVAALAVHARAVRQPLPPGFSKGLEAIRSRAIDSATGLLIQAVSVEEGKARGGARASATAVAAYLLSFADERTSRALFRALERRQFRTVLGFGGMIEYPVADEGYGHYTSGRKGDIDSGPVVLGFGVSASGFAIGASRAHGDRDTFTALCATAHLFGAPLDEGGARTYVTGGPIGDAILFAMLTAPRAGRVS